MATKRFCDICDQPLKEEDDKPFIRVFEYNLTADSDSNKKAKASAHVMILNEGNHVLTDVCIGCKLKIVNDGKPPTPVQQKIATLQPAPTTMPSTPLPPIRTFEPSLREEPPSSIPPPPQT